MNKRTRSGLLALLLVAMLGGGIAFAAWLTSGTGPLRGTAGQAVALVVTATTGPADLYPGVTGDLHGQVQNPNPYPVTVTQLSYDGPITSDTAGCAPSNVVVATGAPTVIDLTIAAGATVPLVVDQALTMIPTAANACQNAQFEVVVTVTQPAV